MTTRRAIRSPSSPGQLTPIAKPTASRNVAGISERRAADSTSPARITGRGAGETSRRSNQPCSMSRAKLTPVAAPVKPAPWSRLTGIIQSLKGAGNPGRLLSAPKTEVRPRKKIVGASTPGIAAPGPSAAHPDPPPERHRAERDAYREHQHKRGDRLAEDLPCEG